MAEAALAELFRANGEARFARRIARAVVGGPAHRDHGALADVVRDAIPAAARRTGGHPGPPGLPGGAHRRQQGAGDPARRA